MSTELEQADVCEACGCAGEMGFIIKEGDDVAEVTIFSEGKALLEAELNKYIELAKQVSENVEYEVTAIEETSKELTARFKFEVSAEKLIFELKTRSLTR
ncbi:YfcZ/YiiS family protein [Vibrio sp. Isolate25]|uniref:YfcZ/YiiS family protein n=1 Tax=unclassified Vibrio TaxID=2614977 RepID=UPI001EFEC692|nr:MULTISPECIES: YfcZ/YiiS family protein [unclassified Vibrio]MCG9595490.1 YfcZ/YiiS family protein [Vibrio sp. Isolate25]MCG9676983.1 YfcZ/YiiS family protein [Vibrio sp. Isolate24]MCG9681260.1 YfcZ/YiiS family protein [Vibrio sp. Isolate23]